MNSTYYLDDKNENHLFIEIAKRINIISSFFIILSGLIGNFIIIFVFSQKRFRSNSSNVYLFILAINDSLILIVHFFEEIVKNYERLFIHDDNLQINLSNNSTVSSFNALVLALDSITKGFPKVSGGTPYLSNPAQAALTKATSLMQEMKDEFVSIEHLALGILSGNDAVSRLMKDSGLNEKDFRAAVAELRKGARVTSQTSEETYNALNKYAKNLNEMARNGKLDPVIGRDEEIRRVLQILSRRKGL
jgi:ATP-dependent Clp protease ATP-binding subunit ClpA